MYDAIRAFFSPILSVPLSLIYEWTGSYVLAILLLTLIIKYGFGMRLKCHICRKKYGKFIKRILLVVLFTIFWGVFGACVAICFVYFVRNVLFMVLYQKILKLNVYLYFHIIILMKQLQEY